MITLSKKILSLPLYIKILLGMIAGIILGIVVIKLENDLFIKHYISPWGKLFIRLLQLIAIPLVFISLIKGITGLNDISKLSKMGGRTIFIYILTTIISVLVGLGMGSLIKPGKVVDQSQIISIEKKHEVDIESKVTEAEKVKEKGPLGFLDDVVPNNIVSAASDNSKMLSVIFFAVFFGIAALTVNKQSIQPVLSVIDALDIIILRMVDYIIKFSPLGVMALMATLVVDFKGNITVFGALGLYSLTVVVSLLFLLFVFHPLLIHFFSNIKAKKFIKTMYPVQLFAFSTSSSSASLPINLETVEKKLGVSNETASFVLPIGATVNMDGTSCYQTIAILFIAQVLGIDLSIQQILTIVVMTVLSSIGTPGIPGGSFVVLTMVLTTVGIPAEGLALILGIDRPLDMLRTSVNVTGDAAVACIIDKQLGENNQS